MPCIITILKNKHHSLRDNFGLIRFNIIHMCEHHILSHITTEVNCLSGALWKEK